MFLGIRKVSGNSKICKVSEFFALSEKNEISSQCQGNFREFFSFKHGGNKCLKVKTVFFIFGGKFTA